MTKEEAINKVREMNLPKETKEILEALAPELRESRDERIIVRLIEYFQGFLEGYEDCYKDGGCVKWEGLDVKSILAWLEKQKETADSFTDGIIEVRSFQRGMEEGRKLETQKEPGIKWLKSDNVKNPDKPYVDKAGMFYTTDGRMCYASEIEQQKEQKHPNGCFTCDEYKKGYEEGRRNGFTAGYNKAMKEVEQKEQKPRWEINNPHTTKWTKEMIDEKFEELVEEYHKQKPVVTHGETYHVDTLGTQQVIAGKMPQKPTEWSDEDSDNLERVDNYLWMLDNYVGDDCATPQGKVDKIRENIQKVLSPWLKSLPERFNLQSKQEQNDYITPHKEFFKFIYDRLINVHKENPNVDYMRSFKERLNNLSFGEKQEWSEEDERMIDTIVSVLDQYIDYKAVSGIGSGYATPRYNKEIAWLKSLRPVSKESLQSHWKPSEEQMDSLRDTIINTKGYSYSMYLPELYEQLKKLM